MKMIPIGNISQLKTFSPLSLPVHLFLQDIPSIMSKKNWRKSTKEEEEEVYCALLLSLAILIPKLLLRMRRMYVFIIRLDFH